jgi:hypothetical protein
MLVFCFSTVAISTGCGGSGPTSFVPRTSGAVATKTPDLKTMGVSFRVPSPDPKIVKTIRVSLKQGKRDYRSIIKLVRGNSTCHKWEQGLLCGFYVKLARDDVTYDISFLDSKGLVTFRRSDTVGPNYGNGLKFIIVNQWTSATVKFSNPIMGAPLRIPIDVTAYYQEKRGAETETVIGPQGFTTPIPLVDTDKTGATSLSTTKVTSPATQVVLNYDGKSFVNPEVGLAIPRARRQMMLPFVHDEEYELPSHDGTATNAGFGRIIPNADGSMTFLENQGIGHITADGSISETKLSAYPFDIVRGPDGNFWALVNDQTSNSSQALARINSDGSLTEYPLTDWSSGPLVLGPDGNFWMPASTTTGLLRRVTPSGVVADFPLGSLQQVGLDDLIVGPDGNFWFDGSAVRFPGASPVPFIAKMTASGASTMLWLPGTIKPCCDATVATLTWAAGAFYTVATSTLSSKRFFERITPAGLFHEFPPNLNIALSDQIPPFSPTVTLGPDGALWYPSAGLFDVPCVLGRSTTRGDVAFVQFARTCAAPNASLALPAALAAGPGNTLWYARGDVIGKVSL